MKKGKLIVMSGPSGVGKGTVIKKLLKEDKNLMLSISATTRGMRKGETDKVSYYFTSVEDFEKMIEAQELLEYAKVFDNYYGTPKKQTLELIEKGQDILLEIDTIGALQVKEIYPNALTIFIAPPTEEVLYDRLKGRGTESEDIILKRFKCASEELNRAKNYDYIVINDDLEDCVNAIYKIIKQ